MQHFLCFPMKFSRWGGTFADHKVLVAETADFFEITHSPDFLTPPWISCENDILTIPHFSVDPGISPKTCISGENCVSLVSILFYGFHQKTAFA